MITIEELKQIKDKIEDFKNTNQDSIHILIEELKKLESTSLEWEIKRDPIWSPNNQDEYYDTKKKLKKFTAEKISKNIENKAKTQSLSEITNKTNEFISIIVPIQKEISNKLFYLDDESVSKATRELYQKIKETNWERNLQKYMVPRIPEISKIYLSDSSLLGAKCDLYPLHIRYYGEVKSNSEILNKFLEFVDSSLQVLYQIQQLQLVELKNNQFEEISLLIQILNGFHSYATALQTRTHDKEPLMIQDEYDVQYLLRGLLKIFFSDVRDEEYTPSYAGSSTRVDFLLKNEEIVVEVKKTRDGLNDKKVGDELIIDFDHYQAHQNCKKLVCFVYDPEHRLKNPIGLINDLNTKSTETCSMYTIIVPIA